MLTDFYSVMMEVGGEQTLAAITGFTPRHVVIWRNRGWFPAVTYPQIRYNLLARGLDVSADLFGPPMAFMGMSKNLENKNFLAAQAAPHLGF